MNILVIPDILAVFIAMLQDPLDCSESCGGQQRGETIPEA